MNWGRTKTIFILVFMVLNSFLGLQLWEKYTKQPEMTQVYDSSIDELLMIKNIVVQPDMHTEQPILGQLHVQIQPLEADLGLLEQHAVLDVLPHEEDRLLVRLQEPFELPEREAFDEDVFREEWLEGHVLHVSHYRLYERQDDYIKYVQVEDQYPLFAGQLLLHLDEEGRITEYEQMYFQILNRGTAQSVLSSANVLRALLENQSIPDGAVITEFRLGYHGQLYEVDSQVLTPTWRIMYEHQQQWHTIFVNALTGNIETTTVEE